MDWNGRGGRASLSGGPYLQSAEKAAADLKAGGLRSIYPVQLDVTKASDRGAVVKQIGENLTGSTDELSSSRPGEDGARSYER